MKKAVKGAVAAIGAVSAIALGQIAEAAYFYRRTMKRNNAKVERTMKMAGTDWSQYMDFIGERKEALLAKPREDIYCRSEDGLKLHATYIKGKGKDKLVICFHGYTSEGMKDYIGLSGYYLERGYSMLLVDERAHGESEGNYIGFGCLDRQDALLWIAWAVRECGEDVKILLHGTSMGGAAVLMASGLKLPAQVKGIISDCGFTSPKYVFTHVLHSMYHLPAFPVIQIADYVNRKKAGYGMDECNAAREVKKAAVPILLIHGDADTFVPCSMCEEIYANCASPKRKVIIKGAAHAESYYKDTAAYEKALDEFTQELAL
ncbi:MAG: alpha/beta hydrolase [Lachnospiraceae bacterium]|nr:alpha/beta hydrolase [Lachnospiraceae bacterium]